MSTEPMPTPAPAVEPKPVLSPFGRIFGVLFSPKPTFEDIVRKPSWLLPMLLLAILGVIVAVGINQKMNWRSYIGEQIEKNPRAAQLSSEQKQQQIEIGAKFAPISAYAFGIPAPLVVVLVVTLVMWGAYNLLAGANANFMTAFGITSHAFVPVIVGNLLFLLVLFLKPYGTLDIENPVATNLAAFLPEDTPKWLSALGKNLDIFVIWVTLLIAVGFAAANPKKLKGAKPYSIAFGLLAVYVVLRMGFAFIFS